MKHIVVQDGKSAICIYGNLRNKIIPHSEFLIPNSLENALRRGTGNPSPTIFLSVFTPKFSNWSDRYRIRPLQKFGSHSEFAEQNNYKLRITNYALINRISS